MMSEQSDSIVSLLFERKNGNSLKKMRNAMISSHFSSSSSSPLSSRVNETFNNMGKSIRLLRTAIESRHWQQMESAVEFLVVKIVDAQSSDASSMFSLSPAKKLERDIFVELGGVSLLLQFFEPPLSDSDGRTIPSSHIQRHVELWNEVLVILREVCFAFPSVADNMVADQHITFLFTLLSHDFVFENAMNLIEELLASKRTTYCLSLVPNFSDLVKSFSSRRLGHFCRVLALLLFDPDDRPLVENIQILRSMELLGLRRDRMSRKSNADVEANQSIVLATPCLLPRLVTLLRVVNYGPSLQEIMEQELTFPSGFSAEFFMYVASGSRRRSEWEHLESLEDRMRSSEVPVERQVQSIPEEDSRSQSPSVSSQSYTYPFGSATSAASNISLATANAISSSLNSATTTASNLSNATATALSSAANTLMEGVGDRFIVGEGFLPNDITDSAYFGLDEMDSDDEECLNEAADPSEDIVQSRESSQQRTMSQMRDRLQDSLLSMLHALQPSLQMPSIPYNYTRRASAAADVSGDNENNTTSAQSELKFHALALVQHQVELLFVFCSLLTGRRKVDVQKRLAALGLVDVLMGMYPRMSWGFSGASSHNPLEHVHGPNCECTPESALRVQFLRLAQSLVDRDFHNNPICGQYLSPKEREVVLSSEGGPTGLMEDYVDISSDPSPGLMSRVTQTLISEPFDSPYRFWLSSCIETYLRGSGSGEQLFLSERAAVGQTSLLDHLIKQICDSPSQPVSHSISNLQASFDLLGELIKYNERVVEMLERKLLQSQSMGKFLQVVLNNVVDSNVLLRSLLLTVHSLGKTHEDGRGPSRGKYGMLKATCDTFYLPPCCVSPAGRLACLAGRVGYARLPTGLSSINAPSSVNTDTFDEGKYIPEIDSPIASVTYLTHTWLFYSPVNLSQEAIRVGKMHAETSFVCNKTTTSTSSKGVRSQHLSHGKSPPRNQQSPGVTASLTSGMRDAIQSIRDITSSFIRSQTFEEGRNGSSELITRPPARSVSSNASQYDFKDAINDFEEGEGLQLGKELNTVAKDDDLGVQTSKSTADEENAAVPEWKSAMMTTDPSEKGNNDKSMTCELNGSIISPSCQHLSSFLVAHGPDMIFRLMHITTIRSINHENICCVNTTLLFFITSHRSGHLGRLLHGLKYMSKQGDYRCLRTFTIEEEKRVIQQPPPLQGTSLENMRELLWFWMEYYLRRGRDRLSLEYSSHIPFSEWFHVVDDGSETALLDKPIPLQRSPYSTDYENAFTYYF